MNGEYYHVYNRTTGGITIFSGERTLKRSLGLVDYYRFPQKLRYSKYLALAKEEKLMYENEFRKQKPLVELFAFSLMPNHYHLLLKQIDDGGIKEYVSNFQKGYAKYFNVKNKRFGSVFQGPFKAKHIDKNEYLLHLSRYIHLNPVTSYLINIEELEEYPWTSFPLYFNNKANIKNLVNTDFITKIAGSYEKYKKFVYDQADYQRKLNEIKGLLLD